MTPHGRVASGIGTLLPPHLALRPGKLEEEQGERTAHR